MFSKDSNYTSSTLPLKGNTCLHEVNDFSCQVFVTSQAGRPSRQCGWGVEQFSFSYGAFQIHSCLGECTQECGYVYNYCISFREQELQVRYGFFFVCFFAVIQKLFLDKKFKDLKVLLFPSHLKYLRYILYYIIVFFLTLRRNWTWKGGEWEETTYCHLRAVKITHFHA